MGEDMRRTLGHVGTLGTREGTLEDFGEDVGDVEIWDGT